MGTTTVYSHVRAIYHNGLLSLLDPLELPEGAQVWLSIQFTPPHLAYQAHAVAFIYPTRLVPAKRLDSLTGLVAVGGDAVADSEALYDPDWA